jgi:predicted amidohydrolase
MRLACIANSGEIGDDSPDLIVLPEYSCASEIDRAVSLLPTSIIVAAVQDGQYSRGLLIHEGRNLIDYLKCGTDGHTQGTGVYPARLPVLEYGDSCIGVVICMDIQDTGILLPVVERLRASGRRHLVLCIPAAMQGYWFGDGQLGPAFNGVHTLLSNHPTHHEWRCGSFIADPSGQKVRIQLDKEPLHLILDDHERTEFAT